jgi:outer membrane lipase/esterase
MFTLSHVRTVCALTLSLSVSGLTHAAYSKVISFGDSLSDVGNVYTATALAPGGPTPGAPYFNGRFSDGPVWVETLATGLGLSPATASLLGGDNYSWGGARVSDNSSVPSVQAQIGAVGQTGSYFDNTGGVADPNALYTVLIGGNDINAVDGSTYTITDLQSDALAVANSVNALIAAGAESVLVGNVPDLGGAPVCDGNEAACTGATDLFNGFLSAGLAGVDPSKLIFLDLFTIGQDIQADLAGNGFTNGDANCLATAYTGPGSCDTYVFWDTLHPTGTAHEIIGDAAVAASVPVPAALPLMLSALMGLGAIKRARKA